jgi:hypothetical protein
MLDDGYRVNEQNRIESRRKIFNLTGHFFAIVIMVVAVGILVDAALYVCLSNLYSHFDYQIQEKGKCGPFRRWRMNTVLTACQVIPI